MEQARELVESDEVLLMFQSLGTPTNNAIRPYMNTKKVPQLFVATGATQFGDPKTSRGLSAGSRPIRPRGEFMRSLCWRNAAGKIGILYQNDDSGRDYVKGFSKTA